MLPQEHFPESVDILLSMFSQYSGKYMLPQQLFSESVVIYLHFPRYELLSSLIFCPLTDRQTDRQKAMHESLLCIGTDEPKNDE